MFALRQSVFYLAVVLGSMFGTFVLRPALSQSAPPPDTSGLVETLKQGLDHLRGHPGNDSQGQGVVDKAQEAYQRLFATIRSTDRTCRALTRTMRSPEFARSGLWLDITAQLQANGQQQGALGYESRQILEDFKAQIKWYDMSPGHASRVLSYKVDSSSRTFQDEVQRYFTHPEGMDVCRVSNPFGQLQRFAKVQDRTPLWPPRRSWPSARLSWKA
jgi:hypothetical protein